MTMTIQPVQKQVPICSSSIERIFDVPGSILYRVEATLPDGTMKVFDSVRAYASSLKVTGGGHVSLTITSKSDRIYSGVIPYPYHFLHQDEWLCALKIKKMETLSDDESMMVALNYNLFTLPWKMCLMLHDDGEGLMAFLTSRQEWERGEVTAANREVQMFLRVSKERMVPAMLMSLGLVSPVNDWVQAATCTYLSKRK